MPDKPFLDATNASDTFHWLVKHLGTGPLAGYLRRGQDVVHCPRVGEAGYIAPPDDGDDNGPATVVTATVASLRARVSLSYDVTRLVKRGKAFSEENCLFPADPALLALAAPGEAHHLRTLHGVTHTPIVRRDGSILSEPGFDDATGYLLLPDVDIPPVPEHPTEEQVAAAAALLQEMVCDFDWAGKHDQANYLGVALTPLLRMITPPPYKLAAIMAHQPGSGKTLLASLLRILHGGVVRSELPHDDAELEKVLTSILTQTTAPIVQFDNVTGVVRSSRLAGLLTSNVHTGRILGATKEVEVANDRVWVVTGNNVTLGGDLVRRTLWIAINPDIPNPHLRTDFRHPDLEQWVQQRRGELLHALLVLVTGWVSAGRPMPERESSDSFARWRQTVAGILTHAGIAGGFDAPESVQQKAGLDDEGWGEFLLALREERGRLTFTVGDIVKHLEYQPAIADALPGDLAEKHDRHQKLTHSLGAWFRNRKGRWVGDLVCEEAGRDPATNTTLWRVRHKDDGDNTQLQIQQDQPEFRTCRR